MNLNAFTKLSRFPIDLDAVMKEFFERGTVKDTIVRGARKVNRELELGRRFGGLGLQREEHSAV